MQARLDAAAAAGGAAAPSATQGPAAAELARQLEALRQQLAFRDAEAAEERRRSAERDARLAEAQVGKSHKTGHIMTALHLCMQVCNDVLVGSPNTFHRDIYNHFPPGCGF